MNPCGQIVDELRSCYTSTMRLVPGDPTSDIPITWYWAPPGAKRLDTLSAFGSSNWDVAPTDGPFPVGEDRHARRRYSKGQNVWGYTGRCRVGSAREWEEGLTPETFAARQGGALPACCGPGGPQQAGQLGAALAVLGSQRFIPGSAVACGSVSAPRLAYYLDARGVSSDLCDCSPLGQVWRLALIAPCQWQSAVTTWCGGAISTYWFLDCSLGAPILSVVAVGSGLRYAGYHSFALWPGNVDVTLSFFSEIPGACTWPATLTILLNRPLVPLLGSAAVGLAVEGSAWPWPASAPIGLAFDGLFQNHGSMLGSAPVGLALEGSAWPAPWQPSAGVGLAFDGLFQNHGTMLGSAPVGLAVEASAW